MEFLARKVRALRAVFVAEDRPEKRREITRFEGYFELCYKVLSWEDASLTLTVFLVLNFVFWLVIQLQLRFFGVIFLLTLLGFVADTYFETTQHIMVQAPHLDVFDELKNDLGDVVLSLKALRKDSPSSVRIPKPLNPHFVTCLFSSASACPSSSWPSVLSRGTYLDMLSSIWRCSLSSSYLYSSPSYHLSIWRPSNT
jgi:hypothetical protein